MNAPAGLVKVSRKLPLEAVRFDGTKAHAEAIIHWIRESHDYALTPGHFQSGTLFQPVRSGAVLAARPGWWIVRLQWLEFVAYAPDAFASVFEVIP